MSASTPTFIALFIALILLFFKVYFSLKKKYFKAEKRLQLLLKDRDTLFDSLREGLLALHKDGRIFYYNKNLLKLVDIPESKNLDHFSELNLPAKLKEFMALNLESSEDKIQKKIISNDADNINLWVSSRKLINEDKKVIGSLFLMSDISKDVQHNEMKKSLVANLSHQLKTPITNIRGYAETIEENPEMPTSQLKNFISVINEQSQQMNTLVDHMLLLSKIESEDVDFPKENFLISETLKQILSNLSQKAKKRKIQLSYATQIQEESEITGNQFLIYQALANIVDNAIKYSPENSPVEISLSKDLDFFIIKIADEGYGIDVSEQKLIFERFYQTQKKQTAHFDQGFGLGLSLTRRIIKSHNGSIHLESEPEKGSTFTIRIPHS